jgi:hypothetical protein
MEKTMSDETTPAGQVPAVATAQSTEASVVTQTPPPAEDVFDKERAMATINALRTIEKQAKQDAKELARLKTEEQKRADAELSEIDRLKKQYAEIEANNAKLQADILRRDVVNETGLPAIFADRLKGDTKEAMLADAQEILKVLPQQITTKTPHVQPTNPGNPQTVETDAQKRDRLFGKNGNIFDLKTIEAQGGGVRWTKPPGE